MDQLEYNVPWTEKCDYFNTLHLKPNFPDSCKQKWKHFFPWGFSQTIKTNEEKINEKKDLQRRRKSSVLFGLVSYKSCINFLGSSQDWHQSSLVASWLRISCCHYFGLSYRCGSGLIPDQKLLYAIGVAKKKKKKKAGSRWVRLGPWSLGDSLGFFKDRSRSFWTNAVIKYPVWKTFTMKKVISIFEVFLGQRCVQLKPKKVLIFSELTCVQ